MLDGKITINTSLVRSSWYAFLQLTTFAWRISEGGTGVSFETISKHALSDVVFAVLESVA